MTVSVQCDSFALPPKMSELIRDGKCCVFIGSGLSIDSYARWGDFIRKLATKCGISIEGCLEDVEQLLTIAEQAKLMNPAVYRQCIYQEYGTEKAVPPIYMAIMALPFQCYMTTNFDPLLRIAARKPGQNPRCHAYPDLLVAYACGGALVYLHGLVENADDGEPAGALNVVLSQSEFEAAYAPHSRLVSFLLQLVQAENLVFVGCGLREPLLNKVLTLCAAQEAEVAKAVAGGGHTCRRPARYVILPREYKMRDDRTIFHDQDDEREKTKFLESMGAKAVWYDAINGNHSALVRAFNDVAGLKDIRPQYGYPDGGSHGW